MLRKPAKQCQAASILTKRTWPCDGCSYPKSTSVRLTLTIAYHIQGRAWQSHQTIYPSVNQQLSSGCVPTALCSEIRPLGLPRHFNLPCCCALHVGGAEDFLSLSFFLSPPPTSPSSGSCNQPVSQSVSRALLRCGTLPTLSLRSANHKHHQRTHVAALPVFIQSTSR
jgi:hypothetical protein